MTSRIKKAALASALAATTLASASPAMAQGYPYGGYRHRSHGDTTGAAIVGGIVGIAIGALIASSGNNHHRNYARNGWEWRDGYYWDRDGRRYDRNGRPCDEDGNYRGRGYGDRDGYYDRRGYGEGYYGGY